MNLKHFVDVVFSFLEWSHYECIMLSLSNIIKIPSLYGLNPQSTESSNAPPPPSPRPDFFFYFNMYLKRKEQKLEY